LQVAISAEKADGLLQSGPLAETTIAKKKRGYRLARLYEQTDYPKYAERVAACGTHLVFTTMDSGRRALVESNWCKLRLCPVCVGRKARRNAKELTRVMDLVELQHPGITFLFLTLTVRDVPGDELGDAITHLLGSWGKLMRRRPVARAIKGWYRTVEITYNDVTDEYHPHIHAVLVVENEYFKRKSGLYITHDALVGYWRQSLQVDYDPGARIQRAKGKPGRKASKTKAAAVALEAAKYATKDVEYLAPSVDDGTAKRLVATYTRALHNRRFSAYAGWLLDAQRAIEAKDKAQAEDKTWTDVEGNIRPELVTAIDAWGWSMGAGAYMLLDYLETTAEAGPLKGQERQRYRPTLDRLGMVTEFDQVNQAGQGAPVMCGPSGRYDPDTDTVTDF